MNKLKEAKAQSGIVFYPGGFKPPHKGHFNTVQYLSSLPQITQVIIVISSKESDGITALMSKKIWQIFLASQPNNKVKFKISTTESPVKDLFDYFDGDLNLKAYVAGTLNEPEDVNYIKSLIKAFGERVIPINITDRANVGNSTLSSTQVRGLVAQLKTYNSQLHTLDKSTTAYSKARNGYLNTLNTLKSCFPDSVNQKGYFDKIVKILDVNVYSPNELQENIFSINWWKNNLGETLNEEDQDKKMDIINDFISFVIDTIELKDPPKITFTDDEEAAKNMHALGTYNIEKRELTVIVGPRLLADVLRTLAHELVHRKQDELGMLKPDSGETGSPIENEANAAAGILMRLYGAKHTEIYEMMRESIELQELSFSLENKFDWEYKGGYDPTYTFSTGETNYIVKFVNEGGGAYERIYAPVKKKGMKSTMTGEGKAMKINATVMDATLDFLNTNKDWYIVTIHPIDPRRYRIVTKFLYTNLPKEKYNIEEIEGVINITRK
jgi:hypothetical protein